MRSRPQEKSHLLIDKHTIDSEKLVLINKKREIAKSKLNALSISILPCSSLYLNSLAGYLLCVLYDIKTDNKIKLPPTVKRTRSASSENNTIEAKTATGI